MEHTLETCSDLRKYNETINIKDLQLNDLGVRILYVQNE